MKTILILVILTWLVGCSFSKGKSPVNQPTENQISFPTASIQETVTDFYPSAETAEGNTPTPSIEIAPPIFYLPVRENEPLPDSQGAISTTTIAGLKLLYLSYRNAYRVDEYFWVDNDNLFIFPGIHSIDLLTMRVIEGEKSSYFPFGPVNLSDNVKFGVGGAETQTDPYGYFAVCDLDTGQIVYDDRMMVWTWNGPKQEFYGFPGVSVQVLSPEGRYLATGGSASGWYGSRLTVWDIDRKEIRHELLYVEMVGEAVAEAQFSPDGNLLAASTYSERESTEVAVKVWSMDDGSLLHQVDGISGNLSFDPEGKLLAVADGIAIQIIDIASGMVIKSLEVEGYGEFEKPNTLFSPDGSLLVSYPNCLYKSHEIGIWDVKTGELLTTIKGCGEQIAFSPDGRYMISNYKLVEDDTGSVGIAVYGIWNGPTISTMETKPIDADCNHPYLPLISGANWTYHLTFDAPQKEQISRTINTSVQDRFVSDLDGINVWNVIINDSPSQFKCGSQYDVWEQLLGSFRRLPPVDRMSPGFTWIESRIYEDDNGNPASITFHYTIMNMAEQVSIPAGDFITVVIQRQTEDRPNTYTMVWLAENVGIIKIVTQYELAEGLARGLWELQSYTIP